MGKWHFSPLFDVNILQGLLRSFHPLLEMPLAVFDVRGQLLAEVGQEAGVPSSPRSDPADCPVFHGKSDPGSPPQNDELFLHRCRYGLWELGARLGLDGRFVGTFAAGPFFLEVEPGDEHRFLEMAKKQGLDELSADSLRRLPKCDRKSIPKKREDFLSLANLIFQMGLAKMNEIESEKILRENEEKYRTMVEHSVEMIWTLDRKGNFLHFNRRAEEITGFKLEEFRGKSFAPLLDPKDLPRIQEIFQNTLEGRPNQYEIEFKGRSGESVILSVNTAPIFEGGLVVGTASFGRDITGIRRAEEEKTRLERRIQEAQKLESLGLLAGGIAHDFNNILGRIIGNASLARGSLPGSPDVEKYLSLIEKAANHGGDLCRQLLNFSGKGNPAKKPIQLSRLVEETMDLLNLSVKKKTVLRFALEKDLPVIQGDPTQIRQVLMNLVINASEATGEKGEPITISTGVCRAPPLERDYVYLEVRDKGCGMTSEALKNIGDPFFTTKSTGRGLGLAVTSGIVRSHQGSWKISSEPGAGSTFKILFPKKIHDPVAR